MLGLILLKDKKGITITNVFQKVTDKSKRKPNKIWVNKGCEFYSRPFKSWAQDNKKEMYSAHNEGKSVVDEKYITTLKNKIYKHMNAKSKNVYCDKWDDTVDKHNNTYHRTINMKHTDVKRSIFIDFDLENNDEDPKFKVGDHVEIWKQIFLQKAIELKNLTTINILLLLSYIITIREKFYSKILDQKLNHTNLATKVNIANFIDNTDFN